MPKCTIGLVSILFGLIPAFCLAQPSGHFVTEGFAGFSRGTPGNAGQNLYISAAGVLQRIHHSDLTGDGLPDLLICNSQNHWERPPVGVHSDVFGNPSTTLLPSDGSLTGALADLNGDPWPDLVLGMDYNGSRSDLNAFVYFGTEQGYSERYRLRLPAPRSTACAAGDFNGDGRGDVVFLSAGKARVFYQSEVGLEPKRFVELQGPTGQFTGADLDTDGCADLVCLDARGKVTVYWGDPEGLALTRLSELAATAELEAEQDEGEGAGVEYVQPTRAIAGVVELGARPPVFAPGPRSVRLVPVTPDRQFGEPLVVPCPEALAVAAGDVNGDDLTDLAFASRHKTGQTQHSRLYLADEAGFAPERAVLLPSVNACDAAIGDLDGDGHGDIALCQDRIPEQFTFHSPVYRGGPEGVQGPPVELESHDARRVFISRTQEGPGAQVILVNHRARNAQGDVDVAVYENRAGNFSADNRFLLDARDAVDAVCCDLADTGTPDILLANCSENAVQLDPGSLLYTAEPEGYPYETEYAFPTTRAHGVCCADVNRDGYLDLLFGGFSNSELLIFHGGPEGFDRDKPQRIVMEIDGVSYNQTRWIYLADWNADGWLDLFVPQIAFDRSFILWGGQEGFDLSRRRMLSVWHASCAQAADLDGNGYLELIVGGHEPSREGPHDSFVHVYWNGPEGLREDRRSQLPANAVNALAVADFNKDGHADLFVCNYHDGRVRDIDSYLYFGSAQGFSEDRRRRLFMHSASGAVPVDFNGDGWVDLAVAYHKVGNDHVGYSAVWWNGPEGFCDRRVTHLPTNGPHGMVRTGFANQANQAEEEFYISEPLRLPAGTRVLGVDWEAEVPGGCWVRAQVRYAPRPGELEEAEWEDVDKAQGRGRWVQYRLALGAPGGTDTPRVTKVTVRYER